ncbi:MAG: hypothetical protein HN348_24385 [Proteobacteria bacterium]|nr:hypothetical protein [Pseudomonadota bacterium]
MQITPEAHEIRVERNAPLDAQDETVVLKVDGERQTWHTGTGHALVFFGSEAKRARVHLDPERHLRQTNPISDALPRRLNMTMAAWIDTINLRRVYIEGSAAAWVRPSGDTHNVASGRIWTDQDDLFGVRLAYARKEGPLIDGLTRRHVFSGLVKASLLNQNYAEFEDGRVALGTSVGWSWNNRVDQHFPLRGASLAARVGGGFIPNTSASWLFANVSGTGIIPIHPRHVVVGRLGGTIARSDVPHRLSDMGGAYALRSLPIGLALTEKNALALVEYRWAPLRNVSVPLLLAWGSELQLTAGMEAGIGTSEGELVDLVGATAGIAGVGDVFGAEPAMIGFTAAWPIQAQGIDVEMGPVPELYLRWWQEF